MLTTFYGLLDDLVRDQILRSPTMPILNSIISTLLCVPYKLSLDRPTFATLVIPLPWCLNTMTTTTFANLAEATVSMIIATNLVILLINVMHYIC